MKEIKIVWHMGNAKAEKLTDFIKMEQTPELKENLDRLSQVMSTWWKEQAEKYLDAQECTYEEKLQVINAWKESMDEGKEV